MASRRRRTYNRPSESRIGESLTSTEESEINSRRELAYNTAAAEQYMKMKKGDSTDEKSEVEAMQGSEASRVALAKALGHDPNNAPPLSSMMARFYSLPPQVQAGIYKQGGAHFIKGETGMKLLGSVAEDKEKALDSRTNEIGAGLASGKINYDTTPEGKMSFYSMLDDETDPTGMKKKKVPLNALQLSLLDRGFQKGIIPNPMNPEAGNGALPTPKKQTTAEFQAVLDTRAMNGNSDTDVFQRELDTRNAPALSPYKMLIPMANAGEQFGPSMSTLAPSPVNTALQARDAIGRGFNSMGESSMLGDIGDAIGQTVGTDIPNWLNSFLTGRQEPMVTTNPVQAQLSPMDAAFSAEEFRRKKKKELEFNPMMAEAMW